ncbi:DUF6673 domain-containing protein [Hathewaya histolytica]|uniref:DUF6673 domain-containing protein n=1 Tax=Hathewaya histolytica TaxID=1498 RepID=A0A4U9R6Z2_HATHI|nr:DUF6673 family protein [Hathewaya histolytica]VTQ86999.1 Uncharacterised protein [Hathewaya histolytica]
MKINGVELQDIDIFDVEVAEKYEKTMKKVENIGKEVEGLTFSESIRTQCNAIFEVFNSLFGEGTDKKVFGNKANLVVCLKAFEELMLQINEQKNEIEKMQNKYSPNRASRRAKK